MVAAEALFCLVVAVADGDTLTVRCGQEGNFNQVKVRLAEIDAPEKSQAFGQISKQHLSDQCFGQQAYIKPQTTDRYGRTVARVECRGLDANAEQVRAGLAWAYTQYLKDPEIKRLEKQARESGSGLWGDENPVAPWIFRKLK